VSILVVLTNLPDRQSAEDLARFLVEDQLAGCVNVLSSCRSIYRWKGEVEETDEVPLLIKTTEARYAALEAAICARHPYEVPEIIALPVTHGLPDYLAWLTAETQMDNWLQT